MPHSYCYFLIHIVPVFILTLYFHYTPLYQPRLSADILPPVPPPPFHTVSYLTYPHKITALLLKGPLYPQNDPTTDALTETGQMVWRNKS